MLIPNKFPQNLNTPDMKLLANNPIPIITNESLLQMMRKESSEISNVPTIGSVVPNLGSVVPSTPIGDQQNFDYMNMINEKLGLLLGKNFI